MDVVVLALVLLVLLPLVCCAVYTPIQRESGMRVFALPPSASIYNRCEDDAGFRLPLTALAGPPADTQSYSSVG